MTDRGLTRDSSRPEAVARKVSAQRVRYQNRFYHHPALVPLRGRVVRIRLAADDPDILEVVKRSSARVRPASARTHHPLRVARLSISGAAGELGLP